VNAVVIASQVVSRLAAAKGVPVVDDSWRQLVPWLGLPEMLEQRLKDTREITTAIEEIEDPVTARIAYSCTHMTVAPTVIHGGGKTNVIPDEVIIEVDVRTLPGMTADEVDYLLMECIGEDLETFVTIERLGGVEATRSSTDTNLYRALGEVANELSPGAVLVPTTTVGSTDAAFFRQAEINAYGFALFSRGVRPEDFRSRFHGPNERIDLASLALTGEAWLALARRW
jgi:acetylornithine deacetylase/succinyl-diaminopimelate desuccinylase-like protein